MQLGPAEFVEETQSVRVTVPPTRSDILHAVDIIEVRCNVLHKYPEPRPTSIRFDAL